LSFQSGVASYFTISSVPKDFGIDITNGMFKTTLTLFWKSLAERNIQQKKSGP
jgi:hypothetical protein